MTMNKYYDIKEINDGLRERFISIVRDLRELSKEYHFKRKNRKKLVCNTKERRKLWRRNSH